MDYSNVGELKMFRQGLHIKTSSIITDENVQAIFTVHLREMKDENRTPDLFMRDCNDDLFKKIPNSPLRISISTAERWMKFLGYHPKIQRKGYYNDAQPRRRNGIYR